ncbi:hypothetical protein M5K25_021971 [Dendrobium thyrsiflorum]|uniref:Ribosomal protein L19 n=1 Tax=Dendrobium thyrsiflorum TaxID=117978 RepID=A0ABD0U5H7_DENTH
MNICNDSCITGRMQMFWRSVRGFGNHLASYKFAHSTSSESLPVNTKLSTLKLNFSTFERGPIYQGNYSFAFPPKNFAVAASKLYQGELLQSNYTIFHVCLCKNISRHMTTLGPTDPRSDVEQPPRIKFKRLDKTAKHIMNILDKEAVEKVKAERDIPEIKPGYIVQLKVEVPENKRRVSILKGIVIAKRNAGLNSTFRLRRLVAGVGVESVFPLYSPNIKEMKVLDKKKVRRAKLYYLRERMNPLKK